MLPMRHSMFGQVRPPSVSQFIVGGQIAPGGGAAHIDLSAARVGDLFWVFPAVASGGSGGAWISTGVAGVYRSLAPADITLGLDLASQCIWGVYRGPYAIVGRSSSPWSTVSPAIVPGFSKASNCCGVLGVASTDVGATSNPVPAAPFVSRVGTPGSSAAIRMSLADVLDPALYAGGSVSFFGAGGSSHSGYLMELLF